MDSSKIFSFYISKFKARTTMARETALHLAVLANNEGIVRLLIDWKADVNAKNKVF